MISQIQYIEDMGVEKDPYKFYRHQLDALEHQRQVAQEVRDEYASGMIDPSLKIIKADML